MLIIPIPYKILATKDKVLSFIVSIISFTQILKPTGEIREVK